MRLRSWGLLVTALFTATTAMADANFPARNDGYSNPTSGSAGPRWYGYFYNNSLVAQNADHTNITMVGTTVRNELHDQQVADAIAVVRAGALKAQSNNEKAMVDVESIVFMVGTQSGHACYTGDDSAKADFNTLVQDLIADGTLIAKDPVDSTVVAFYVADEPNDNCLHDIINPYDFSRLPDGPLVNAVTAIRQNLDTPNFPLATIVQNVGGNGSYDTVIAGLGLFDWIGLDDYGRGTSDYLNDFQYMEDYIGANPYGSGTSQRFFMVPAVSYGAGSFGPYIGGAPALYQFFANEHRIIGIMPFKWSADTDSNGMNQYSSWAPEYIALGKSIVPTGSVTLSPKVSHSGSFALSWALDGWADYYQVYQSAAGGGAPWTITTVSANAYTATNLANGVYTFQVYACEDQYGYGCYPAPGQTIYGVVNISAPVSLSLSPATSRSGSFTLSWKSSWNGPYPLQQYRIFQSFNGGGWTWAATVNNTTSYVFTDLATGSYAYYVVACNQGSAGAADCSGNSGEATETVALSAPSGLTFSPSGTSTNGSFTLSWNSTWNGPYPLEQYRIYQSSNGGASWTWAYTINNTTSKAISGLGDGTYTYKIQACNYTACSSFSSTASETVSTGGGGTGGGCPPPPYQCQLVMPDDYATLRGDQVIPGHLALAKQFAEAMGGVASVRAERAQRAPSPILPGEEVAWQQRWRAALAAAPEMAPPTGVHRLPSDDQLARRVNALYERFQYI